MTNAKTMSSRFARLWLVSASPLALSVGFMAFASPAAAITPCSLSTPSIYSLGASGDWNTAGNWNPSGVPGIGGLSGANVCVVDGSSTVSVDTSPSVGSLQIASGNTVSLNSGQTLDIAGPSFLNAGAFTVDASTGNAVVNITGTTSLSGGGAVNLNSSASGNAFLRGNGVTLTNVDNTISGSGLIGDSGALALANEGTIDANVSGGTLDVNAGNGGVTNTGTMEATGGGTLALRNATTNTNGVIQSSGTGSTVNVIGSITGGSLTTSGGGVIQSDSGGADLSGVTITAGSTYTAGSGSTTELDNTMTNKGTLLLDASAGNATVNLGNSVELSGGGTVQMNSSASGTAFLRGNGVTLTNDDNSIQGNGEIGDSGGLAIANKGTINANVSGGTLDVNGGNGGVTNTGTMEATNGGTLALRDTTTNTNGVIQSSGTGSTVNLIGSITGGSLTTSSGGVIESDGGGTDLNGVTITAGSTYSAGSGSTTELDNTITNKGTLAIAAGGANAVVNLSGGVTLTGGGTITLSNSATGTAFLRANSATAVTNVNNTIEGAGELGDSGSLALANEGTINANVSGGTLDVNAGNGGVTNTGTMEATAGGILTLRNTTTNTGGVIQSSGTGSTVNVIGSITGGSLTTSGGGVVQSDSGGTDLNGVTITAGSTYSAGSGSTTELDNTITNKGTLAIAAGGANTAVNMSGGVTLTGGGAITLSNSAFGTAFLRANSATAVTNVNNTIEGAGELGDSGSLVLNNEATIDANVSGQTLDVNAGNGGVTNTGTMEATGGGFLTLRNTITNTNGLIKSGAGSTVNVVGTIIGGTLTTTGSGLMQSDSGGTDLDGVTISSGSTYTAGPGTDTELDNTITNKGTFAISAAGQTRSST
jgi:fibronectin-binding autotransporter adhesin